MKGLISFLLELCFVILTLTGLIGGNFYFYNKIIKNNNHSKYIEKNKIISVNINKLLELERKKLIKKYKTKILNKIKNQNLTSFINPSQIIDNETSEQIKEDLNKFNIKLDQIISALKNRGYIIIKSQSVIDGVNDATSDFEKILNLSNNKEVIHAKNK